MISPAAASSQLDFFQMTISAWLSDYWAPCNMATIDEKQLQTFAEEYFSSQNYLNKRILEDVSKVRSDYDENIWSKMNVGEREKVIALTNL